MGWAKNNPEKYAELEYAGVTAKLERIMAEQYGTLSSEQTRTIGELANALQDLPDVWLALVTWAHTEVADAEADHFGSLIDAAKERTE